MLSCSRRQANAHEGLRHHARRKLIYLSLFSRNRIRCGFHVGEGERLGRALVHESRKPHLLGRGNADDAHSIEDLDHEPSGIYLKPPDRELGRHTVLVVVVLKQFTTGEKVDEKRVTRSVTVFKVAVPVLVATPVHDCSVDGSHHKVRRKQQVPPSTRRKSYIEADIVRTPGNAREPVLPDSIESGPSGHTTIEAALRLLAIVGEIIVAALGGPHHRSHIAIKER